MNPFKIIFTGPVGAGKSTAIRSISDIPPTQTDAIVTDKLKRHQATTTEAIDYGILTLVAGEKIHLYKTSEQKHFDSTGDTLTSCGIGLILLLDNTRPDPFQDMKFFLDAFSEFIDKTTVAIGVTQMDLSYKPTINDYHAQLQNLGLKPAIFTVDARVKNDVSILIQTLLYSLNPGLESNE